MKKFKKLLFVLILFAVCPMVQAKEVDHFTTKADTDVVMDETYNASVAAAGESVDISGVVNGIAFGAGNKITFNGQADYGFILGNTVLTNGTINKDAFVFGNIITTNEKTNFKRDAVIFGADIELNGTFDRNVSVYSSKVTIKNAKIMGNVKIYAENIYVEKGAVVSGKLSYPEDSLYKVADGAKVSSVEKSAAIKKTDDQNYFATVSAKIWSFLCYALVFATISLIFPKALAKINNRYEKIEFGEIVEVFTKGLVTLIVVPAIAILLCLTMIGIPLGIIMVLLYGIAWYLTTVFAAYLIGYKIWQKVFNKETHVLFLGLIGLFILFILSVVPGVRLIVSIITTLIGLGLIIEAVKNKS